MLVSDIVKTALSLVGREDAAAAIDGGEYEADSSLSQAVRTMLYCANAVEDELARGAFPLEREEVLNAVNGRIYYVNFYRTPVKILSVKSGDKKIAYKMSPEYLETNGRNLTIKYIYCPRKRNLTARASTTVTPWAKDCLPTARRPNTALLRARSRRRKTIRISIARRSSAFAPSISAGIFPRGCGNEVR